MSSRNVEKEFVGEQDLFTGIVRNYSKWVAMRSMRSFVRIFNTI